METQKHIIKLKGGKYRLLSNEGKNLGTFDSFDDADSHDERKNDDPNYSEPQMQPQLQNASGFPQVYYARHMESGLCAYENEKILVDADTMKKMASSFAGKPVYVQHQTVDLKSLQEDADGYVADCFYNEVDGWLWSKIIIVSDAGKKAVSKGWSVSNAYIPTSWSGTGSHHNFDYNRKIGDAEFTHLAIVPDPRYENAKIFTMEEYKKYNEGKRKEIDELRNSKRKPAMKFWKTEKKEVAPADIDDETVVELRNGKTITVKEIDAALAEAAADPLLQKIAQYEALENAKKAKSKKNADDDKEIDEDEVEEDGAEKFNAEDEEMLKKLTEKKNKSMKKNESEDDEDGKKEKKNDLSDEEKAAALKKFNEINNAKDKAKYAGPVQHIDLDVDQLKRGQECYGSTTK